jgi:hypothetical protein
MTKTEIDAAIDSFYETGKITAVGARYGKAPHGERSYNAAANSYEAGVSMMQVNDLPGVNSFAVADAKDNRGVYYYIGQIIKTTGGDNEFLMADIKPIGKQEYVEFVASQQGQLSSLVLAFWRSDVLGRIGVSHTYPELWQRWEDAYNAKLQALAQD